jgi:hypothetical protein
MLIFHCLLVNKWMHLLMPAASGVLWSEALIISTVA